MAEREKEEQKKKEAINAAEKNDTSDSDTAPFQNGVHPPNPDQIMMVMSQPQTVREHQLSKPSLVNHYSYLQILNITI